MKPTMRRSGQMYATIRTQFHVHVDEVIDAVAAWAVVYLSADDLATVAELPDLSRAAIDKIVRDGYAMHGGDVAMHNGDILTALNDDEVHDALWHWAYQQVRRTYPTWTGGSVKR